MKLINKKMRSMKKKGGCGCSGSQTIIPKTGFFSGGTNKIVGGDTLGPVSLTNFDPTNNYTYPLNTHIIDPISPSEIVDSRGLPNSAFTGGKNKKSSKNKKDNKKRKTEKKEGKERKDKNERKEKKERKDKRRTEKRKRGGAIDPVLQSYDANSLSNFSTNSVSGAVTGSHIVAGQPLDIMSYQSLNTSKPFL